MKLFFKILLFIFFTIKINAQKKITQENIRQVLIEVFEDRYQTEKIYGPISQWDTSEVTDMSNLFQIKCMPKNPEIQSCWYGNNVEGEEEMMRLGRSPHITNIQGDISNWDVSSVTNMSNMFSNVTYFNQDISKWDVSNVTDMSNMFSNVAYFNQDISKWDVSNVTDMSSMFSQSGGTVQNNSNYFNQDISKWNVSKVKTMEYMFMENTAFNQNISSWDVSSVKNMVGMFNGATHFNQDLSSWNVSNVSACQYFSQDTSYTTTKEKYGKQYAGQGGGDNGSNYIEVDDGPEKITHNWSLPKPGFTKCTP